MSVESLVQKLCAQEPRNPVRRFTAGWPWASPSSILPVTLISWNCLRFPIQRGCILLSGRNMGMYTWFLSCARLVALTGRLAEANVEFTAWIWSKMVTRAL